MSTPREHSTLTIVRTVGEIEVPITERSVRRFSLMQDDYIQLEFSLAEAEHFAIGDYVVDAVFGKFVVTTEQMPKYNTNTGGYDYSLRLDADYMAWQNRLFCLVADSRRMETSWRLTDTLAHHAQQIVANLDVIGITGYSVSVTADNASEVKYLQYNGVGIIEAMRMMAEAWGCEWWVANKVIHFGKMENSGEPYEFRLGDNVESMDIARDQQTFATRIYGYGGTKNVPETYDSELVFEVTENDQNGFKDSARPLRIDMIAGESTATVTDIPMNNSAASGTNTYSQTSQQVQLNGAQTLTGNVAVRMKLGSGDWTNVGGYPSVKATLKLHNGSTVTTINESGVITPYEDMSSMDETTTMVWDYGYTLNEALALTGQTAVYIEVIWTLTYTVAAQIDTTGFDGSLSTVKAVSGAAMGTKQVAVTPYGTDDEFAATFNGENGYIHFNSSVPASWGVGSRYRLSPLSVNIPISYYTRDYTVEGMSAVGERRIHLTGYRYRDADDATAIVEAAVVWDDEYPRLNLRIKNGSIYKTTKTDTTEHEDGSVSREDWKQYSFEAEYYNDANQQWEDYRFDTAWILDGEKLQAVFGGGMLNGMTFDVGYNNLNGRFTIIRNEDFGAKLPNEYIYPASHDAFFLTGWNPQAMYEMGLIAASQTRLEQKVNEYLSALQEGQFTFSCRMMSGWLFDLEADPFIANPDEPFVVVPDAPFMVSNGYTRYRLPDAGDRVTVYHDALPGGEKTSRIIGYECKLDKPYDTPTYTIGETEAYSRLKQLEKRITKLG